MKQYRQGDLLIEEVSNIPKGLKKINDKILARGEGSNHVHVIDKKNVDIYENDDLITTHYLRIWNKSTIKHLDENTGNQAEHDPIVLDSGNYKIIRQREFNPYKQEIERVQD